jgi:hypothetical protein
LGRLPRELAGTARPADREQRIPPVVVAFPDCFTRLGGNQYINSASTGAWEDFLLHEMLPAIEQRFGCGDTGRRGVVGKTRRTSRLHMRSVIPISGRPRPCHSGDMASSCAISRTCQRCCVRSPCRELDRALVAATRSSQKASGEFLQGDQRVGDGGQLRFRSNAISRHPMPVTFDTCKVIEESWANWLRQDPVVAIETQANNLRRLKALYIDCGDKHQFNLLYGARRFVRRLNELGIEHRYEEFPDNHSGVDYRMDES